MEIKYFEDRNDWRKWLIDNFETANEICISRQIFGKEKYYIQ